MALILAGRLAMTLSRIPGFTHRPLSAEACSAALAKASASIRALADVRRALGVTADIALARGKPTHQADEAGHPLSAQAASIGRIEILLPSRGAPRIVGDVKATYMNPQLPDGALLRPDERLGLPDGVLIAGPELAFLLESRNAPVATALVIALELCGIYDLAPDLLERGAGSFLANVNAAMTPTSLASFLDSLPPRTNGRSNALKVARLAASGSASPMESRIFCALSLPARCGGYGLKGLKLNVPISLNAEDRMTLGTQSMRVDIMASSGRVGIEYESHRWHEVDVDQHRIRLDKKRIAVARFHDITLVPLTWDIVRDQALFDQFVRQFARIDGIALRDPSEQSKRLRLELHEHLFGFGIQRRAA